MTDSVTCLETDAFAYCYALEYIRMSEELTRIGNSAFDRDGKLSTVTSLGKIDAIFQGTFSECSSLKEIEIPETCTMIDAFAFESTGIKTLIVPKSVTSIAYRCFADCPELENIYFLGSVGIDGSWVNCADEILGTILEHEMNIYYVREAEWIFTMLQNKYGDKVIGHLIEEDNVSHLSNASQEFMQEKKRNNTTLEGIQDASTEKLVLQEHSIASANVMQTQNPENKPIQTNLAMTQTPVFDNLFAGEEYVLCVMKDENLENVFLPENIVYIDQATANEQGKVNFTYNLENETEEVLIKLYGKKKVQTIELSTTQITLKTGETDEIRYTITPEEGYIQNKEWLSSDESIVTVQEDGTIQAVGIGTATITLKINDISSDCNIIVSDNVLKGDVNKDGKVTLYDAFKILEVAILGSNLSAEELTIMDYNEDDQITLYDAFKFLEMAILG